MACGEHGCGLSACECMFVSSPPIAAGDEGLAQLGDEAADAPETPSMEYPQPPILHLVRNAQASDENAALADIAAFIRRRVDGLDHDSVVCAELRFLAQRLDRASRAPHPEAQADHQGTG